MKKIEKNNIPATGIYFLLKEKYGYTNTIWYSEEICCN